MTPFPRIAILANPRHAVREPFAGGLESHTWHLCRELTRLGADTTLFAPAGSDPSVAGRLRPYPVMTLSSTAAADHTRPSELELYQHHAMVCAMAEISADPRIDVVHNQTLHYLPIATAALLPPLVTTLHTPPFSWLESAIRAGDSDGHHVAVSEYIAGQFADLTVRPPRVIHNGVDTAVFSLGPGGRALAWTGRIVPEKAPHLAIAVARRAGLPLRIMGPISDTRYFESQVRPLLGPGVEYLGHLDRRSVADVLQDSLACLVTSVWPEPFGLTAAEALCCGTPVVGFAVGGLPEVVAERSLGILVPVGEVDAAAEAVSAVAVNDRVRTAELASRRFSLREMATSYLSVFTELAVRGYDRAG